MTRILRARCMHLEDIKFGTWRVWPTVGKCSEFHFDWIVEWRTDARLALHTLIAIAIAMQAGVPTCFDWFDSTVVTRRPRNLASWRRCQRNFCKPGPLTASAITVGATSSARNNNRPFKIYNYACPFQRHSCSFSFGIVLHSLFSNWRIQWQNLIGWSFHGKPRKVSFLDCRNGCCLYRHCGRNSPLCVFCGNTGSSGGCLSCLSQCLWTDGSLCHEGMPQLFHS